LAEELRAPFPLPETFPFAFPETFLWAETALLAFLVPEMEAAEEAQASEEEAEEAEVAEA
jgi:hypothetical protein